MQQTGAFAPHDAPIAVVAPVIPRAPNRHGIFTSRGPWQPINTAFGVLAYRYEVRRTQHRFRRYFILVRRSIL
jgi:hypothetical protein